MPEDIELIR